MIKKYYTSSNKNYECLQLLKSLSLWPAEVLQIYTLHNDNVHCFSVDHLIIIIIIIIIVSMLQWFWRCMMASVRIFVLEQYLFQEVQSCKQFSWMQLKENCELWGTDNVQEQISSTILCQMEAIVFIILHIFFATHAVLKIGEHHLKILQF